MIGWYPGHMVKAQREIEKHLPLVDFVVEVLDARAPLSTVNPLFDKLLKDKKRYLLMTKTDMADDERTLEFTEHFRRQGKRVIACDMKDDRQWKLVLNFITDKHNPHIQRGLIVGVPNVGKSTFINRWIGRRSANVADRVGVTKQLQWFKNKDTNSELLDSAGISMPRFKEKIQAFNMAIIGSLRLEVIPLDEIAQHLITYMMVHYPQNLEERYTITGSDYVEALNTIAKRFSKIRGGEVDYDLVYELILNDFRRGLMGKVTLDQLQSISQV